MHLRLKSKNLIKIILGVCVVFISGSTLFFTGTRNVWCQYDYKILDFFYKQAVKLGHGPEPSFSPKIIYLILTDATYDYFGKNYLARTDMAKVNTALSQLNPSAVAYDIIFARESTIASDTAFSKSVLDLGSAYFPTALTLSDKPVPFSWRKGRAFDRFRSDCLKNLHERGKAQPFYAGKALLQHEDIALHSLRSGHINSLADPDSVYRHNPLLIQVDDCYYPSFSLAVFLNWAEISTDTITVDWGNHIILQATENNALDEDIVIPIDEKGRVFIPFVNAIGYDFNIMEVQTFLNYFSSETLRGNLLDYFEGNIVLIADAATGTSDLGYTPLEANTPLVSIHASVLNGLLTNTFYTPWPFSRTLCTMGFIFILILSAALLRHPGFLYGTAGISVVVLVLLTGSEFIHFRLFPVATVGTAVLVFFLGLTITLEIATAKDRIFIRTTFAHYVPEKVVTELLDNPGLIKLGGEENVATVLFSDIAGFTTVSETLSPRILVSLLNEYFTEMTEIILYHNGIIDKYQGDAIMAEFGVPLQFADHADQATLAALKMQRRLAGLKHDWHRRGLPQLECRVGINSDTMIVGNIGSNKIFDYTVIGDGVNLASRLEGANKRYGTALILSQNSHDMLTPDRFKSRVLDFITVKGKTKPVKIFEVYGLQNEPSVYGEDDYYVIYDKAFETYLAGDLKTARELFVTALSLRPEDPASTRLISRIENLLSAPLPPGWDGSVSLTSK